MARGLTVRALAKLHSFCERLTQCNNSLQAEGKGVNTAIYVDDATMVLWTKNAMAGMPELNHMAYEVSRAWTDMVVNILRLQTSDKTCFVPPGPAAEAALQGGRVHDCTAKIEFHGFDLGVDTVAGPKRVDAKLKARAVDSRPRAERNNIIVKTFRAVGAGFNHIRKVQAFASQGLGKPHGYGSSARRGVAVRHLPPEE